jgi:hypothetical protein
VRSANILTYYVTDKGLENEYHRCDPVAIWGLG